MLGTPGDGEKRGAGWPGEDGAGALKHLSGHPEDLDLRRGRTGMEERHPPVRRLGWATGFRDLVRSLRCAGPGGRPRGAGDSDNPWSRAGVGSPGPAPARPAPVNPSSAVPLHPIEPSPPPPIRNSTLEISPAASEWYPINPLVTLSPPPHFQSKPASGKGRLAWDPPSCHSPLWRVSSQPASVNNLLRVTLRD